MQKKITWECRYAPSLGPLEDTPENIWGTLKHYDPIIQTETGVPCVFFGLYGLPDFYRLWRYQGRKAILWAGTDITHFSNGYWLDTEGRIKVDPFPLAKWIEMNCENYVENNVEKNKLKQFGINAKVVPSFLGNVAEYQIIYEKKIRPALYTSVSGDEFNLYGWHKIYSLALSNPGIDFFLYGNSRPFTECDTLANVFLRGRIKKEIMNQEIQTMQGALRLTKFDGFSEIIAKSLLWGQWPVSLIEYPCTIHPDKIKDLFLPARDKPNYAGREWLLSVVNKYPWNQKQ